MRNKILLFIIILRFVGINLSAQNLFESKENINWKPVYENISDSIVTKFIDFEDAVYSGEHALPFWSKIFTNNELYEIGITDCKFISPTKAELEILEPLRNEIGKEIHVKNLIAYTEKKPVLIVRLLPFIIDSSTNNILKLKEFKIIGRKEIQIAENSRKPNSFKSNSVLQSGTWYKIGVTGKGIYKIDYNFLNEHGINISGVNAKNIGIFWRGSGMLPENNAEYRTDDLVEIPTLNFGLNDGKFDANDYLLIYSPGLAEWKYNENSKMWEHKKHIYSDTTFFFLSTDKGSLKGVENIPEITQMEDTVIKTFEHADFIETEVVNVGKTGRNWLGDIFDIKTSYNYNIALPSALANNDLKLKIQVAAKSQYSSSFDLHIGNNNFNLKLFPSTNAFASVANFYKTFNNTGNTVDIKLSYNKSASLNIGYLDFINIQAQCKLEFSSGTMQFRNFCNSNSFGRVEKYEISTNNNSAIVWDISNPLEVKSVIANRSGNLLWFKRMCDRNSNYIIFDKTQTKTPVSIKNIRNQNLHAIQPVDYIIVTPEFLYSEAMRLATFQSQHSDLSSAVVLINEIYNEFSGGSQDITAIRDFVRMLYERSQNNTPKYLLLFGDASYDYKNIIKGNTNIVPTYESEESFNETNSICSDDYFGYLDENEGGQFTENIVDIGIGRLPITSIEQAENCVNKIIKYHSPDSLSFQDWRNKVSLVTDDEENSLFFDSENLADIITSADSSINIDKIYLDAYKQVTMPSGSRYPEVNKAIQQNVEKGSLLINYSGHGSYMGWAHEQILTVEDINNFQNIFNLPVFVTGTCSFAPFDDPEIVSAGELMMLNKKGGAIALLTTARLTYGSPNFVITARFFEKILNDKTKKEKLGDYVKYSKQTANSLSENRKFLLIGDPATTLAKPSYSVVTTHVGTKSGLETDTLKAFDKVAIKGIVADHNGNQMSNFNGIVTITVFDKPQKTQTLGNDNSPIFSFYIQKNIVYKGKAKVVNGEFSTEFQVPKDISYNFGKGKISYYATDFINDAKGYKYITIGGQSDDANTDNNGPEIKLFMNDLRFQDGGITDINPWLIALVKDESGINTVGVGVGHDITAVLDGNVLNPYILNDFYETDVDTYTSGRIQFPFSQLSPGKHTIDLKVWDIHNNSSTARINFTVYEKGVFNISRTFCIPNPFSDRSEIIFEHNQKNTTFETTIDIFTTMGNHVKTLKSTDFQHGSVSSPVVWDGTNESGNDMPGGLYIYKIFVRNSDGISNQVTGKIVKLNR